MLSKMNARVVTPSKLTLPTVTAFLTKFKLCQALYRNPCFTTPLLSTASHIWTWCDPQLPFSVMFLPFHCRNAAILKPTGGSQFTSLARNDRNLCYGRQTGRAAVWIGQPVDINGMCKWSHLLSEGAEQCQGSAAEGVLQHEKHSHKKHTLTTTPAELWLEALK